VKVSGGLFYDMTIHDFDMCRYIIGQEATEVYAVGGCLVDPVIGRVGDIDTAMITLTYESGAYCSIDNSRQAVYGYDQRVEVFCSEGCVIVGNQTPYNNTVLTQESVSGPLPQYFFIERYTDAYLEEMRLFIQSVRDDSEPAVTGRDGKIPVVMAKAANESLATGKPVKIE
jgi:myo-inositol 2-dehydrogenase/D-chiro-inositol 1-dehydrogenase